MHLLISAFTKIIVKTKVIEISLLVVMLILFCFFFNNLCDFSRYNLL